METIGGIIGKCLTEYLTWFSRAAGVLIAAKIMGLF